MANERVIICGAGRIFNAWAGPLKEEGLQIVAFVDLRPEAARQRVAEHQLTGAAVYDNLDQALRDLRGKAEFLLDLTIPDTHCDVTCKALEAGLHVIGEKPMAATLDQARRMIAASEKTGRLYMVSQSRRWDRHHHNLAHALSGGAVGRLTALYCDYFRAIHLTGWREGIASPLILDMAIHHFDMARMFTGRDAVSVYAQEFNPPGSWFQGDPCATCLFEMEGGLRFVYNGSWCAQGCPTSWNGHWRCIGERGTLLYADDQPPAGETVEDLMTQNAPRQALAIADLPIIGLAQHGALREMLAFLRHGARSQCECHDNFRSLAMVEAALESSRSGKRVPVARS